MSDALFALLREEDVVDVDPRTQVVTVNGEQATMQALQAMTFDALADWIVTTRIIHECAEGQDDD